MISYECEIICFEYEFMYDCSPDSDPFKCDPGPVQMQTRTDSKATRFESKSGPLSSRPVRLSESVCPYRHQNRVFCAATGTALLPVQTNITSERRTKLTHRNI